MKTIALTVAALALVAAVLAAGAGIWMLAVNLGLKALWTSGPTITFWQGIGLTALGGIVGRILARRSNRSPLDIE